MKSGGTNALTFHWSTERTPLLYLTGFVLLSLFLHALAFYVFQVAYPPSVSINPPPVQASLLTPSTPGYQTLMRWIKAGDPSLITTPTSIVPKDIFESEYQPSFALLHSIPKSTAYANEPLQFPSAMDAQTGIAGPFFAKAAAAAHPFPSVQSIIKFSGPLSERSIKNLPQIPNVPADAGTLLPSSYLVGISDRGEVRYLFLQNSSGDKNIDRKAASCLASIDFVPAATSMTWGIATIYWGNNPESLKREP